MRGIRGMVWIWEREREREEKEKDYDYMGQWDRIYAWQITRVVKLLVQHPTSHFPATKSPPLQRSFLSSPSSCRFRPAIVSDPAWEIWA